MMRLLCVLLLVACACLCVVIGWTSWQAGGPGAFETLVALGVVFVLTYVVPRAWRHDGPVHQGGDDAHLRPMSLSDRLAIQESEP